MYHKYGTPDKYNDVEKVTETSLETYHDLSLVIPNL